MTSGTMAAFMGECDQGLVPLLLPKDIGEQGCYLAHVFPSFRQGTPRLDFVAILTEMIDLRSFSNLWYWIALAVLWSTASHWVLGVPFDMVYRARKHGSQPAQDLEDMVRINVNRLLFIGENAGHWLIGISCFVLSVLATMGFYLQVEFAQAVFLLLFPMATVTLLSFSSARQIRRADLKGDELYRALAMCRLAIQFIGMVSIFITAVWGMYQNLRIGVLG